MLQLTTEDAIKDRPDAVVTGGRWVACNKGDLDAPKVRCRYVATEVNKQHNVEYYAATPPLEANKLRFYQHAHCPKIKGAPAKLC